MIQDTWGSGDRDSVRVVVLNGPLTSETLNPTESLDKSWGDEKSITTTPIDLGLTTLSTEGRPIVTRFTREAPVVDLGRDTTKGDLSRRDSRLLFRVFMYLRERRGASTGDDLLLPPHV